MPQVELEKKTLATKWKVVILVVVFVVMAGGGAALFMYQRAQDQKAVKDALAGWQPLVLRGHYDEALTSLKEVYPRAHSKQEQLDLLYYEGATSLSKNDMKAAQTSYKKFVEVNGSLTYESARQLGYAAAQLGEKAEAIDYDQKAIELLKKSDNPRKEDEAAEMEARVKALESSK